MSIDLIDMFTSALSSKNISIVEFAESDEYCNKPLYPRQRLLLKLIFLEELTGYEEDVLNEWINNTSGEVRLCPKIRERTQILRDQGYKHFREVMLVGGRRSSKGHVTGLAVAKKLYDLIQLGNPQEHYGIDPDKHIWATVIAASEDQAKRYQFADVTGAIRSCNALQKYWNKFLEKQISLLTPSDLERSIKLKNITQYKTEMDLASLRIKPSAANASTIRGEATMVLVMDEMAWMMEGVNSKSSADEIFSAATPALDQFGKDALIFENSSPYQEIGKFYENFRHAMNMLEDETVVDEILDPRMFAFQFPSWELYKDWEKDPQRRFKNAIQLSPEESPEMALEEQKNPEKFAVERRAHFAKVVDGFLNSKKVDEMFQPWEGRILHTKMDRSGYGPEVIFKGHCDPATTTANFGIAIGHLEWAKDDLDRDIPHVIFDFVHCWRPMDFPDHTINFLDIQDEILEKIKFFRPKVFSFDQFQSKSLIQWLRRESRTHGIADTQIREVVATEQLNAKRAYNFKTALNLNMVHAPHDFEYVSLAKNELKFLQEKGKRIVKQDVGPVTTKDIADCIMEVTDYLLGDWLGTQDSLSGSPAFGGQRGYTGMENNQRDRIAQYYDRRGPEPRTRRPKTTPNGFNYSKNRRPGM